MTTFAELGLSESTLEALTHLGYENPTPIQEQAIPALLRGPGRDRPGADGHRQDRRVRAADGRVRRPERPEVQALVLTPTRELCIQVTQALRAYGEQQGRRTWSPSSAALRSATRPRGSRRRTDRGRARSGRVMDMIGRHHLFLDDARYVVLDEADEMLDLGFLEDVESILARAPMGRQTALFSATVPPEIRRLAEHVHARPGRDQGARRHAHDRHRRPLLRRGGRPREAGRARERAEGGAARAGDRLRAHQDRRGPARAPPRRRRRAREGPARRHVPGPARRRDDRVQGRARAPARGHRRRRARARHHGRQPRRQLRHPQLARHLRAPHRPDRPGRRERPRDHA